ncbi:NAD-dependent epimerase/dehydratase family protein [Alkalihalobacillus sp. MEB130]|uniref:NAD-dependent epimerase/dehydratase family protein n=1 Tax=Alkalihalobacillus sp. MEB130 TaxID=2976704 RepID=UPI0028DEA11A|nr:NAD-dependent epimerase/dehydratase family protein [Alkalihalobacillus sp. MEB130]MDT8861913.1 NAD-dependent epimerase/dehydratase family protein [Alkalihalobacillus sp. MEB130]
MNQKTALVIGATGLIGRSLVSKLIERNEYKRIYVFVRKEVEYHDEKIIVHVRLFEHVSSDDFPVVDDVFCCIGTTMKKAKTKEAFKQVDYEFPLQFAKEALAKGATQFLVISSIGASSRSSFFYSRVKGEMEKEVMKLAYSHIHIFRPSLLLGQRSEIRVGEKMGEWGAKLAKPILRGKWAKYGAISGETVAEAMIHAALTPSKRDINVYESNEIMNMSK